MQYAYFTIFTSFHHRCLLTALTQYSQRNMSGPTPNPIVDQSTIYVINAIKAIHEMEKTFPIIRRYLVALQGRLYAWVTLVPQRVKDALAETGLSSPAPSNNSPINPSQPLNAAMPRPSLEITAPPSPTLSTKDDRKPSAPEFLAMASNTHVKHETPPPGQQFFWNQFPGEH